ncbi:hypothetical protein [Streptomyces apocyni]|uniref:hypothetical protein n=1 Tax=Streptomyces apocyni TaxID=2654677 RepID=UPI0018D1D2E6|nr:hypothetical protein [Streptomyces apocyni]
MTSSGLTKDIEAPPGDHSPLPATPIAATDFAAPHPEKEATPHPAPRCHEGNTADSHPPLLASAWYSTKDLATRLRIDLSISARIVMYSAVGVEEWLRSRRIAPNRAA